MEVEDTYYKKIIYKKNAFLDLQTYIKLNYNNKKILLISTKSVPVEELTNVMNALMAGSECVCNFVAKNNFDNKELDKLNHKINSENYDLIVSLGAGRCCDVCKYFAYKNNISYIVCPSLATSMAFFTNYCINPYNMSGFYANMPNKIFIQESLIRGASFYSNVMGLCFLNSLRAVYVEGICSDLNEKNIFFKDMDKLFKKLEYEQSNILLCDEDSNLVLMDLFIDFGFFMAKLDKNDYFLFNFYNIYSFYYQCSEKMSGILMLLCAKIILSIYKKYLKLNTIKQFELPKVEEVKNIVKNDKICIKFEENNNLFTVLGQKNNKFCYIKNMSDYYNMVCNQYVKISEFCKSVKNVYKQGLEFTGDYNKLMRALLVSAYTGCCGYLTNMIAGSGILNCLLIDV